MKKLNLLQLFTLSILLDAMMIPVFAAEWQHGFSRYGDLKYKPGFTHFDYVNPDAPKGGHLRDAKIGTFNNLHPYIDKGRAAACIDVTCMLTYDRLMKTSIDELRSAYGVIAEAVHLDDDFRWVEFRLDPRARFHDGHAINVEDVIYTFNIIKSEGSVGWKSSYQDIISVEQTGDRTVKFHFSEDAPKTAQLALHIAAFWVLPKHYWETRKFHATTLEIPLGQGPYKITKVQPGKRIVYERVKDYWAKDLPAHKGYYNIDKIEYIYFLDKNVVIEAHKAGVFDYRLEDNSKIWSTMYDFDGIDDGVFMKDSRVVRQPWGHYWGWMINTRLKKFSDPRVREAITLAENFEFNNRVLYYNQYNRNHSYFQGSDMAAGDTLPSDGELELLEPFRDVIPPRVFTEIFNLPKGDGFGRNREALIRADELLTEAGWVVRDAKRVNQQTGEPLTVSFLSKSINDERSLLSYASNLHLLGIGTKIRVVEISQFRYRTRHHDFELMNKDYPSAAIPLGWRIHSRYHSDMATKFNTENYAGISNPAIDFLVEKLVTVESEEEMNTVAKALDRILLWSFYMVPEGYPSSFHLAHWNRFDDPRQNKRLSRTGYHDLWWVDPVKSLAVDQYLGTTRQAPAH